MNWEQRLREVVLAGGALAATACADQAGSSALATDEGGSDAADDTLVLIPAGPNFCCNVNPDPCCPFLHCDASMSSDCACQMAGGMPNYSGRVVSCSFPGDGGPGDAGADGDSSLTPQEGGPSDASSDVVITFPDVSFCCNANPDPCCQYLHCGGALTPQCSMELAEAGPGDAGGDGHD